MTVAQRMTAAEYMALDGPSWPPTQLIDGEIVLSQPKLPHQKACGELEFALMSWSRETSGRGLVVRPIDVLIDEYNVFSPDVLWYAEARVPGPSDDAPYVLPDLAAEVRSPSTWRYDIGRKKTGYEAQGLAELWLVDTAADVVLVFRRSSVESKTFDISLEIGRDANLTSPQLPCFSLALGRRFSA